MRPSLCHSPYIPITSHPHYLYLYFTYTTAEAIKDEAQKKFNKWGIPLDLNRAGKKVLQEKWPGGGLVKILMEGGNGKCPGFKQVPR